MTNLTCDNCGSAFIPRQADARFCSRDCNIAWHAEERREALRQYRAQAEGGTTFHQHALADAEMTAQGRFAVQARPRVACDPNERPLPLPPHLIDPTGTEPSLGYSIDDMEPNG